VSETVRLSTPLVRASIRGADTVPARSRGYDAGKRVNGRKRHLAVDTDGLLLAVVVTIAGIQDRDGAYRLLAALRAKFSTIALVWADGACRSGASAVTTNVRRVGE
jgi:Transposase DDE domain